MDEDWRPNPRICRDGRREKEGFQFGQHVSGLGKSGRDKHPRRTEVDLQMTWVHNKRQFRRLQT